MKVFKISLNENFLCYPAALPSHMLCVPDMSLGMLEQSFQVRALRVLFAADK